MSEEFDLGELFDDESEEEQLFEYATLLLTGGTRIYLPIQEAPQTIMEAALSAELSIPAGTQFWVEGVQVDPNTFNIATGMVITGVGNIKGGG